MYRFFLPWKILKSKTPPNLSTHFPELATQPGIESGLTELNTVVTYSYNDNDFIFIAFFHVKHAQLR